MRLGGMPESLIREVATTGKIRNRISITAPRGGVIQALDVRPGMTLMAGQTLARINGIGTVWLDVAVPEAAGRLGAGGAGRRGRLCCVSGQAGAGPCDRPAADAERLLRVRSGCGLNCPTRTDACGRGCPPQVSLKGSGGESALRVPTEAVIRTGRRALVIVAEAEGRYRPVEVTSAPSPATTPSSCPASTKARPSSPAASS